MSQLPPSVISRSPGLVAHRTAPARQGCGYLHPSKAGVSGSGFQSASIQMLRSPLRGTVRSVCPQPRCKLGEGAVSSNSRKSTQSGKMDLHKTRKQKNMFQIKEQDETSGKEKKNLNEMEIRKQSRAARVAQGFSAAFGSGRDPGVPGWSPMSGSLHGACFSLCLCLCLSLSLCVSHE